MDPVLCELTRVISGSSGYSEHLERADKDEDGPMSGRNRAGGRLERGGGSPFERWHSQEDEIQWQISQVEISLSSAVSSTLL